MYGPLLSVLLMGMIPVWGLEADVRPLTRELTVSRPAVGVEAKATLRVTLDPVTASGIIITDLESGQSIFERNADVSRPMASLTKLMTALIIVENHKLDAPVTVPMDILKTIGNDDDHLPPGDVFAVGDLLSAMLISSSNDAAVALARFHSGTVAEFAKVMNARAKALGLRQTSYDNPIGLDAPLQDSTPRDLAWLATYVLRYQDIRTRMGIPEMRIKSANDFSMLLSHTHQLLHEDSFVIAGKTGTTDAAGQCLLSIVEVHGRRYVIVLLHSEDRYRDMRAIQTALRSHTVSS